eukprot:TRINITY_DN14866_c0_g1_i1.p1 TRINITY_DN14866_c0_g1~~TRINITY_DN14866_c0_g1_i1.p1  ORF type:complete len:1005 (+),score=282.66 TRINITY_DN14866_c0_g1_i1:426-3017(+)
MARSTTDLDRLAYNPPPDYHTALQNNYPGFQQQQLQQQQHGSSRINSSHPEIWHHQLSNAAGHHQLPNAAGHHQLPNAAAAAAMAALQATSSPPHQQTWQHQYNLHPSRTDIRFIHGSQHNIIQDDIIYPLTNNHTYSTPDLNKLGAIDAVDAGSAQYTVYKMGNFYPEYAPNINNNNTNLRPMAMQGSIMNIISNSTPDLAMKGNELHNHHHMNLHNLTAPLVAATATTGPGGGDQFGARYSDFTLQKTTGLVKEEQQEPIYQNQVPYYLRGETESSTTEPIYQNLPAHQPQQQQGQQQLEEEEEQSGENEMMEEMKEIQHYDESVEGLTEGIKIDDSPRKDNSANSALEQDMLMSRKQNGGTGIITSFSAKKGFTLSQENLTNSTSTQDIKTTYFSSAKVMDNNLSHHHHINQEVSADAEIFLAAAGSSASKSAAGGVSSRHKHESSLLSQQQASAISTPVQHQVDHQHQLSAASATTPVSAAISGSSSIKSKMGQLQSNLSLLNLNLSGGGGGGGILSKKKSLGSRSSHSSSETSRKGSSISRSRPDLTATTEMEFKDPTKIPKESIGAYLETKLLEGDVVGEFETIPKKKATGCNTSVAELPENADRNRFANVLPYNENRVKINNETDNKYGYVNASHISATVGSQQRFYIAAQSPMPNTVHNFWSMVLMYDVHLIVMLTELSGSTKGSGCTPYCPQSDGSSIEIGDYTITKKFSSESGSFVTTTLQLLDKSSRRKRQVWHIQFTDWNETGGVPTKSVSAYLQFLEELAAVRRVAASEIPAGNNKNPPVLVHDSAGVGRTGVTILADILLYCLDHNIDINIPKILTHLRQQRMLMVQTVAQYKFIHETLIGYLRQSRLI